MRNLFSLFTASLLFTGILSGCSSTSDVIEEPQAQTQEETMAAKEPVQPEPEPEVALDTTFYFDYDDATIRPSAIPAIKAHAERILKSNPDTVRIEGHADERGSDNYNMELGKRRAEAVRDLLVSLGVNASQIETVSYGEKHPMAMGNDEFAWQKNRRVELELK